MQHLGSPQQDSSSKLTRDGGEPRAPEQHLGSPLSHSSSRRRMRLPRGWRRLRLQRANPWTTSSWTNPSSPQRRQGRTRGSIFTGGPPTLSRWGRVSRLGLGEGDQGWGSGRHSSR